MLREEYPQPEGGEALDQTQNGFRIQEDVQRHFVEGQEVRLL